MPFPKWTEKRARTCFVPPAREWQNHVAHIIARLVKALAVLLSKRSDYKKFACTVELV